MSRMYFHHGLLRIQPTETEQRLEALKQDLIGWREKKGELVASPLLLTYRQAHELIPDLEEDEPSIYGDFADLQRRRREPNRHPLYDADHLFKVQRSPVKLLSQRSRALVTGAPGTGKTVMALTALAQHRKATKPEFVCVVCPLSLVAGWRSAFEAWMLGELRAEGFSPRVYVWSQAKDVTKVAGMLVQDRKSQLQIVITTPQVIYSLYAKKEIEETLGDRSIVPSWLILDESFYFKNREAKRAKAVYELSQFFRNIWELSGMPISRYNDDLYFQMKILYPEVFSSYWKFAKRYCIIENTPWGDKIVGDRKHSLELLKADLADILLEVEFPEEVPDWQPEIVNCPLGKEQEKAYLKIRDELLIELGEKESDAVIPITSLIAVTTYLTKAASNLALLGGKDVSAKEDRLMVLLREKPLPALIWVNYRETAQRVMRKLADFPEIRAAVLTGDTKPEHRQALVDAFQTGELNCLVLNPGVGKYGFTLTAARTAYYLEKTFDGEAFYQSLFRARRIVSTHPVNLVFLLATLEGERKIGKRTVDELIHETVKERSEKAQRLTVGDLLGTL